MYGLGDRMHHITASTLVGSDVYWYLPSDLVQDAKHHASCDWSLNCTALLHVVQPLRQLL
jgi:hypothetical protein